MKVRFNGMFTTVKKSGCGCHGTASDGHAFVTRKTFILPSEKVVTFSINQEYEVSDMDGNFLLSYSQVDKDGLRQDAFTRLD